VEEHLRPWLAEAVGVGTTRTFGPGFVHDVRNTSAAPVVSVHAYAPPLAQMTRYDLTVGGFVPRGAETEANW